MVKIWGQAAKNYRILSGTIIKSYKDVTYQVKYKLPNSESFWSEIFCVENFFDSYKTRIVKSLGVEKKGNDRLNHTVLVVCYDPTGDGNCKFLALSSSLMKLEFYRSPQTLREEVVYYLGNNDYIYGILLELFTGFPWYQHVAEMNADGTSMKLPVGLFPICLTQKFSLSQY